jgi:Flp pilus assembly protein TadG
MIASFAQAEEGQALVVVGLAMVVLMGALVMTVDWGYGLAMRRAAQNQADAAALAAGRLLATSYDGPGPSFDVTIEDVWNAACDARSGNTPSAPVGMSRTLTVAFLDSSASPLGSAFSSTSEACTLSPTTDVPVGTSFVQVRSGAAYTSLFAVITQTIQTAASARARLVAGASVRPLVLPVAVTFPVGTPGVGLSGLSTAPNAALWPIVRRYDPAEWSGVGGTFRLIAPSMPVGTYFVSLGHYSRHEASAGRGSVHQVVTESDFTGTGLSSHHGHLPTPLLTSAVGGCPGGLWNTNGAPGQDPADCDVPNWFYYGYRGSLSVGTDWAHSSWNAFSTYSNGQEPPSALPPASRSRCNVWTAYPYLRAPSCDPLDPSAQTRGDWPETVTGVDEQLVANQILAFIDRYGRDVGGQKAVVVNLFLWDCGEAFNPDSPDVRENWDLDASSGDCSTSSGAFGRVHLLTAVPVTVFESDVNPSLRQVDAHWGGIFGDAGRCAATPLPSGCDLNPFINSAFLVPDE